MMITSLLRRLLSTVPPALSSRLHILGLISLGAWLVVLPLLGVAHPSSYAQLIGGNYTNVASALGAAIAAGTASHIVTKQRAHDVHIAQILGSLVHLERTHNHLVQQLGVATAIGGQSAATSGTSAAAPPATGSGAVPPPVSQS